MTKVRSCTDAPEFNNHPILTDKDKGLRCDKKILQTINDTFDHFFDNHDRGLFIRYDLRYPKDYPCDHSGNEAFRGFQANFMKNLSRAGLDPHYVAVREQSRSKHQHYHAVLLLDGRKTQSIRGHIAKADELWSNALSVPESNGFVEDCTKDSDGNKRPNGIMLRKDAENYQSELNECMQRASYLAKENQKSNTPPGSRELFSSRLTKKNDKKST